MVRGPVRTLAVVALLLTAGCQGLSGSADPASDQRAVDAVTGAMDGLSTVSSYRVRIDGQVEIRADSGSRSVELTGQGFVGVDRRQANLTMRTSGGAVPGVRERRRAFLDEDTLEIECQRLGWARYNLTTSTNWVNYTTLGEQLALLDRTTLYWNGTTEVEGLETAVVTARPDETALQESRELPTGPVGTAGTAQFQNATVRVWIDTETDLIHKVRREIHVEADGRTGGPTITYHFSDYNEPISITRPAFERSGSQWASACPGD